LGDKETDNNMRISYLGKNLIYSYLGIGQIDHKNQMITLSASTVTFSSHITQKIFNKPFLWPEKEMGYSGFGKPLLKPFKLIGGKIK
jgi:hypothetical protein